MCRFSSLFFNTLLSGMVLLTLFGCDRPVVHQKSVSELNQKAAQLMQMGDAAGAVARLEAAHDLVPDDGMVQYNLGIAYQQAQQPEKSIATLTEFVKSHPNDAQVRSAVQSLAVVYEQVADERFNQANAEAPDDGQALTSAQKQQVREEGIEAMKQAIAHYEHLYTLSGLSPDDKTAIETHVTQLKESVEKQRETPAA